MADEEYYDCDDGGDKRIAGFNYPSLYMRAHLISPYDMMMMIWWHDDNMIMKE